MNFFAPSDFKCHYLCSKFAAKLKNRDVKLQKITTMELKKNKAEFLNCNLAGFGHTEGYLVLDEMRPGDKLYMVREDENKHDLDAIALFYVPKHELPKDTHTKTSSSASSHTLTKRLTRTSKCKYG